MLTGAEVIFIGGDARQLEVIDKLIELDASVTLIGFDNLQKPFAGAANKQLSPEALEKADALVLPVVGTDEQGRVESIFPAMN